MPKEAIEFNKSVQKPFVTKVSTDGNFRIKFSTDRLIEKDSSPTKNETRRLQDSDQTIQPEKQFIGVQQVGEEVRVYGN